jgi:cyclic pyranopterin phosphate synthase
MPACGVALKTHDEILSYEQIELVVREAVHCGLCKVRLTGGEPLLRRGIDYLVRQLSRISGLDELCMTTNGTRLEAMAAKLKEAGLDSVNISMDTLDPEKYAEITRGGDISVVLKGIDAACEAGLFPIKINMVIFSDTSDDEVEQMEVFCKEKGLKLQTIMQFSLYDRNDLNIRFHADRPPQCGSCNRLRLTSDGFLKPCLFSDNEIRVDFNDVRKSLEQAVIGKPESGSSCKNRSMCAIGG